MKPSFRLEPVDQRIEALLRDSELYKPEGEGPFPIVLQFHGCGGKKNLQAPLAGKSTLNRLRLSSCA